MTGIVEFLTARLDEEYADAIAAQEADPAPWRANTTNRGSTEQRHGHGSGLVIAGDDTALWDCEGSNTLCMTAPTARHIARHDPARVLREVEAKRALAKLHSQMVMHGDGLGAAWYDMTTVCRTCDPPRQFPKTAWPCLTARLLAAPYADHPDYDPGWNLPT